MKRKYIIFILIVVIVSFILFNSFTTKVEVPEVKEGSFEFSVIYEINKEQITYNGVYICKYNGVSISVYGSSISWKSYIEGMEDEKSLLIQSNDDGNVYIDFGFYAEYFMAEPRYLDYEVPEPSLYISYHSEDPDMMEITNDVDFLDLYSIKIVSYNYAKPIENKYEEKLSFGRCDLSIN